MSHAGKAARSKKQATNWRLVLLVGAVCVIIPNLTTLYGQRDQIRAGMLDFRIFYGGATSLLSNGGAKLYDYDLQSRFQNQLYPTRSLPGFVTRPMPPYNHPPFELLLFLPLLFLPSLHAYYVWTFISLGLAIVCGRLFGRRLTHMSAFWPAMPYALVLCAFPFAVVLLQGQDSMLALVVVVAGWWLLRSDSDVGAGWVLGLGLIKFQIFVPLTIILALWKPRILKGFAASAAILGIISVMMVRPVGLVSYLGSLTSMVHESSAAVSDKFGMDPRMMPNLRGLLYGVASGGADTVRSFSTLALNVVLVFLTALILGWAMFRVKAVRSSSDEITDLVVAFAVTVSLLLSFHLYLHDLILITVPIALVLNRIVGAQTMARSNRLALIALMVLFYLTILQLFLARLQLVYLLGAAVLAFAILVSLEMIDVEKRLQVSRQ